MVPGFFVGGFGGCQSCLVQGFGIIHGVIFSISCSLRIQDTKSANQKKPCFKRKSAPKDYVHNSLSLPLSDSPVTPTPNGLSSEKTKSCCFKNSGNSKNPPFTIRLYTAKGNGLDTARTPHLSRNYTKCTKNSKVAPRLSPTSLFNVYH